MSGGKVTVAFLGIGNMGAPMAINLVKSGLFNVRVWSRTISKAKAIDGATICETPAECVKGATIACTMLTDDKALEAVVFGRNGIADSLGPGAIHIGHSTISVALSERLTVEHKKRNQIYLSIPVFGRPEAAAGKTLLLAAAGPEAEIKKIQPLLTHLGRGPLYLGPDPARANLLKLIGNFAAFCTVEILAEALALGEKGGIPPKAMMEFFNQGPLASPIVTGYGAIMTAGKFSPAGFAMELGLKDLNLAIEAAQNLRVPIPSVSVARNNLIAALARGHGKLDAAAFASIMTRELAGLPPIRSNM